MKRAIAIVFASLFAVIFTVAQPARAQLGEVLRKANDQTEKAKKVKAHYTDWSPAQEQAIGMASAAKLINIFGLYQNSEMVKYVNLTGNAVAREASRPVPYHFAVLDSEVITALSLPGGFVFITRGALVNIHNEAELAGVLAHEVAHVDRRHLEKEIRSRETRETTAQYAQQQTENRVPEGTELLNEASDVVKNALTLRVSRDKETEADRLGMELASQAGYAAAGLRDFLQFLSQVPATAESKQRLGLWGSTHPPLPERIAALNGLLPNFPANGQTLAERYIWYVNPVAFSKSGSGSISASGAGSGSGASSGSGPTPGGAPCSSTTSSAGAAGRGSAEASGGLPSQEFDGVVTNGVVVLQGAAIADGTHVKVRIPR